MIASILSTGYMTQAFHQVRANKGAAGVDGISVNDLAAALRQRWTSIKHQVETGSYYFKLANMNGKLRDIDVWVRRRLRGCIWHDWKKPNRKLPPVQF